jgi:hypothetical protein
VGEQVVEPATAVPGQAGPLVTVTTAEGKPWQVSTSVSHVVAPEPGGALNLYQAVPPAGTVKAVELFAETPK